MTDLELLGQTRIFSGLPRSSLEELAERGNRRTFAKGEVIFYEGTPADAFYLVVEGRVKVFVQGAQGDEVLLATVEPGDGLGEVTVLDGGDRSASAEALEPTTLLAFARSTIMELIELRPGIAQGLLESMAALVRRLTEQTADFVFLDLEGRVAKALLGFPSQEGADGTVSVDLGLTQSDLGHLVGGSRQSVNQILHALASRGYLELDGKRVTITDPDGLRRRAGT